MTTTENSTIEIAKEQKESDNEILVYVASVSFPFRHCLRVTKENLHTLADLASREKFGPSGWRQREGFLLNTLVLQDLIALRMRQVGKYVAILTGCTVFVCRIEKKNIPKVAEDEDKFSVRDVRNHSTTLEIPWEKHSIEMGSSIFCFDTENIIITANLAVTTPGSRTLKEEIQYFVQKRSDSFNAEAAIMYGPTENDNGTLNH